MVYRQLWVERWIREDVCMEDSKNDWLRLWTEPKNIWQELDVKKTERDKKWVRETDELTTKNCKSVQFYSINRFVKRDDSWSWWRFWSLSKRRLWGAVTLVNWKRWLNQWRHSLYLNTILSITLHIQNKRHRWIEIFFPIKKGWQHSFCYGECKGRLWRGVMKTSLAIVNLGRHTFVPKQNLNH